MPSSLTGPWTGFDGPSTWGGIHVDSARVVGVVNALGVTSRPHSSPPPKLVAANHPEAHTRHHVPLRFTGSGLAYFRLWLVNLLCTTFSLGLFHPWARARRLAWCYGHTQVDGQALVFHGKASQMLDGPALLWALLLLGGVAQLASRSAALLGFCLLALVWPYFYRASEQYRLAQTSWRGLHFRLAGRLRGAYHAQLPLWTAALATLLLWPAWPERPAPLWFGATAAAVALGLLLAGPLLLWNSKKYLHGRFSLGPVKVHFHSAPLRFYRMAARTAGVALVTVPPATALAWLAVRGIRHMPLAWSASHPLLSMAATAGLGLMLGLGAMALLLAPPAYLRAELQNLLWSHTGNNRIRFKSDLRFGPLWLLWVKNCALLVVTLGLYWPFAVMAVTRMRLEAITLVTRVELDELVNFIRRQENHPFKPA